ncbi:hypothetical protein CXK94_06475 [Stutzerimonas stutzeri]|uniref:DUF748 domain-containing protein n=1 Tax=Stutzerimonas stutzeri TaxID=316 RepID=A0A2N8T7W5_STUST|nr:DUF748 domain-containing protein [Stutzerimonas stutzeri]MCQ4326814.1 DUF748 domain-containing protein [Stutzerimonas stutzeri]PNG10840.1 hypothetical protein CXK94_06475 [Stutzerimonas stutzeri]
MRRRYLPLWILLSLALLLLLLHLALPHLVRNYLNEKMADMGDYQGHIEDVDLAWWRGGYRIEALNIEKKGKKVQAPLLKAPVIDIAISWRALLREQAVVGRVTFRRPELNFVDGGARGESQTGEGVDWREQLDALLPITLNEVRVIDGQLSFRNFTADPQVHVYANAIEASLYNLTNTADDRGRRVATFEGTGKLFNQAPIEAGARFDPFTDWEDFEVSLRVTGVPLKQLNDFSRAYGKFDFAAGDGDLVLEVEATDSRLDGYIKPLLRNVEIFDFQQDIANEDKGFFRGIWEALVGTGEETLQNQRKDQFATRIELSGSTRDTEVSAFQAFIAILRNAFVEAFSTRFERSLVEDRG